MQTDFFFFKKKVPNESLYFPERNMIVVKQLRKKFALGAKCLRSVVIIKLFLLNYY